MRAEAVVEFLSESHQYAYPHLQGAVCKGKSLSFNTLKSASVVLGSKLCPRERAVRVALLVLLGARP